MRVHRRVIAAAAAAVVMAATLWIPRASAAAGSIGAACVALFSGSPVAGAPPPAWLRPGAVLTYTGQVDAQSAIQQHIILAMSGGYALDSINLYTSPAPGGTGKGPSPNMVLPASGSEFWASPKGLAACPASASGDTAQGQVAVARGVQVVGGARRDVVAVHTTHGLARSDVVYDVDSGVALSYLEVVLPAHAGAQGSEGQLTLHSSVRLPAPFDGAAALPAWVRDGTTLEYQSVEALQMGVTAAEGLPPQQQVTDVAVDVTKVSPPVAVIDVSTTPMTFGAGIPTSNTSVVGGLDGGFWLPPAVLRGIGSRRTLFRDGSLGEVITVARSGRDVEMATQVGTFYRDVYFNAATGVMDRAVDDNGSFGGSATVPAVSVMTTVTRVSGG